MDVTFEVIDGDEGQPLREGKRLGVGDAHQQRSGKPGPGGDCDSVQIGKRDASVGKCRANDGHNRSQMLAAGQFRHHSAVARVRGDL